MLFRTALALSLVITAVTAHSANHTVSTWQQLQSKLETVNNGDTIIVNPGTYAPPDVVQNIQSLSGPNGGEARNMASRFVIRNKRNITIRAANASNKPILKGEAQSGEDDRYILYAQKADGLKIENLRFEHARIAIVIDRSDNVKIYNNNIRYTENEAIHLRDGSDGAHIKGNRIQDVGTLRLDRGEGIYICNDKKKWHEDFTTYGDDDIYQFHCDNTLIEDNDVGPNVGGELIDIKEGVSGTVVRNNRFYAKINSSTLINLKNSDPDEEYRKSLIHDKGVNSLIHDNTFDMQGAKWSDETTEYAAIRAEEIIKDQFCGYNAFGRNGIYVKNKVINGGNSEFVVSVPGDGGANIVVGCDTSSGQYKYHRTRKFEDSPFNIGGTGVNVKSNSGGAVKTNCQSYIDSFSFQEPGKVYKLSAGNYRCASALSNGPGGNYSHPSLSSSSSTSGSTSSSTSGSSSSSSSGGFTGDFDLPGKIEAEKYNDANDTSNGNSGGSPSGCSYYGLNVDVQNSSDDSTCNIGWTASGETLDYNIDDAGGTYNIILRVSANSSGKRVQLLSNGSSLGTVTVNNSGWSGWHNKTLSGKSIPSNSKLTVKFLDGGVNLNYINIVASSTSTSTSSSTSGGGSNIVVADWNNNSAEEGQSTKHVSTSYSNGKVRLGLSTSNNDPYIRFAAPHNVSNYDKIKVRIRNGSSNGKTNFQIYFRKNGNEGGNGKGFTVSANDAWIEKTIDMSGKSNWNGDISHLRIDGPSYGGGNYRIDTVELIANDGSTSSTSSSSTSSSSGGSTSCLSYNSTGLKELSFSSGSGGCVNVSGGLDGMEVNIADSDANPGCDIRGSVTGSNGGSWTVDGNWESPTGLKGSKLTFNVTNNCRHFKLRVRP